MERDKELTRLAAGQIGTTLQEYGASLAVEAHQANLISVDSRIRQTALERAQTRLFVFDGGLLLLDNHGDVVNATRERVTMVNQDWAQEDIFLRTIETQRPAISNRVLEVYGTDGMIAISMPIFSDDEEMWGALVGLFQLGETSISTFYGDIVRLRIGSRGLAYLVDADGRVIYHSHSDQIGQDFSNSPVVAQMRGESSNTKTTEFVDPWGNAIRTTDQNGTQIVAGFSPIPSTEWALVTETKWWLLLSASQEFEPYLLGLLLLGILAPALFVAVGVRRITDPINRLIAATQNVATGNFSPLVETRSGDEIDTLSTHFNQMSAQLQASYGLLENRVAERTRELTILNEMAEAVNSSLELDNILHQALEKMQQALHADGGGVYLFEEGQTQLTLAAHLGIPDAMRHEVERLQPGEGFNGFVAQSGCPLMVDDIKSDGRLTRFGVLDAGLKSLACVPLNHKEKVIGTLYAAAFKPRVFTDQDLTMLASIGNHAAIAIENARLYQEAQQLAAVEERSRLARELHDSVTQSLYSLTLLAEGWRRIAQSGEEIDMTEPLTELGDLGKQALKEMRLLVYQLRPPDLEKEGLLGALHKRLSAVEKRSGIDARLIADDVVYLPRQQEEHLYWIAQEALSNALKHAGGDKVHIRLNSTLSKENTNGIQRVPALAQFGKYENPSNVYQSKTLQVRSQLPHENKEPQSNGNGLTADQSWNHVDVIQPSSNGSPPELVMEIEDNGSGFDVENFTQPDNPSGGLGLTTMMERAAQMNSTLSIESTVGEGTCVRVRVPIEGS